MTQRFFPLANDDASRAWLATGLFMFAFLFVIAPALLFDSRLLNGVSVWAKPLKFCLAMGVHFVTLAVLAQLLSPDRRAGLALRAAMWASIFAGLFEIVYITIQAARGRRSHFNYETEFENFMYGAMGVGAVLLILAAFVLGILLARQRDGDRSGLKLGAVIGLILAPILTLFFAGYMSTTGSHFVGAAGSDAGGLPLFGWSRSLPDLRPAHFAATHAMQILPLIGFLGDRAAPRLARPLVIGAAVLLALLAASLFATAFAGRAPLGFIG